MPPTLNFCVHAHFYQPTRKDVLTGIIPDEPGAWPFSNWNERIFDNCYRPNAELGNFSKISFNIGPTLSEWLKRYHPETLDLIINADRQNFERYGVGNAMAQAYHHTILPLASRRDKQTQVLWGIKEFECTFNRKPQGMWLPETAVDMQTLEVLAENGIEFTILAPWQADAPEFDPRKAYQVNLPDDKFIKVFFYNSELSSRISFDPNATDNADQFIRSYVKPHFSDRNEDQWIMVASDGELYGHHQVFRDKFLSYLLDGSLTANQIETSFPALQLQKQAEFSLMKIRDNTSWSCHHGIQRWHGVCACTPNSEWKQPFREALDHLELKVDNIYLNNLQSILPDPWKARDQYFEVFSQKKDFSEWMTEQSVKTLTSIQIDFFHKLFEAQLDCQRMFTSCGWFFEDFDRIEPRNNISFASHAVWLVKQATGIDLIPEILPLLERVKSWRTGLSAAEVLQREYLRFENSLTH